MRYNNILSYFIKDIKDHKTHSFYKQKQKKYKDNIKIYYKKEIICEINSNYKYNYILNIYKSSLTTYKSNYKIAFNLNYKYFFYKKDNKVRLPNPNYIRYCFVYNKNFNKTQFNYTINNREFLSVLIIYS